MGSTISGLKAEFKLRLLESMILETLRPGLDCWFRCVHDVVIIWRHSMDELYTFLDKVNMLDDRILNRTKPKISFFGCPVNPKND